MSKESNSKNVVIGFAQDSAPLSKIVVEPKKESAPPSKVKPRPSK